MQRRSHIDDPIHLNAPSFPHYLGFSDPFCSAPFKYDIVDRPPWLKFHIEVYFSQYRSMPNSRLPPSHKEDSMQPPR